MVCGVVGNDRKHRNDRKRIRTGRRNGNGYTRVGVVLVRRRVCVGDQVRCGGAMV